RHDKLGAKLIKLPHSVHPDTGAVAAGVVGHDGDLEAIGVVENRLVTPGLGSFNVRQHHPLGKKRLGGFLDHWLGRLLLLLMLVARVSQSREREEEESEREPTSRRRHGDSET